MTVSQVVNPSKWTDGWRWFIGSFVVVVVAVLSTVGTTGVLIGRYGEEFKQFGTQLDKVIKEQDRVRDDLTKTHGETKDALNAATKVAEELKAGREVNLPRISTLESDQHKLDTSLQVLTETVTGIAKTVNKHDSEITEGTNNTRIILDKIAPESSPRISPYGLGPRGH